MALALEMKVQRVESRHAGKGELTNHLHHIRNVSLTEHDPHMDNVPRNERKSARAALPLRHPRQVLCAPEGGLGAFEDGWMGHGATYAAATSRRYALANLYLLLSCLDSLHAQLHLTPGGKACAMAVACLLRC